MKIKSENVLPEGYEKKFDCTIKPTKLMIILNILSIALIIPFYVVANLLYLNLSLTMTSFLYCILFAIFIVITHEYVHGIFFKLGTKKKVKFKFHGFAASASVPGVYYYKWYYIIIGLAPAVIINLLLLIACFFTTGEIFSIIYLVFAIHFAGCIGDFYICLKLIRYDSSTLIEDLGIGMRFFVKKI